MTKSTMTLLEYLRKVGVDLEGDFLNEGAQLVAQLAIELEAEEIIGLKAAISELLASASWQRCRVHFMRNVLANIPKGSKAVVAAAIRTIFAQPDRDAAGQQLSEVAKAMHPRWPKAADLVAAAEEDVLAYMNFPPEHWTRIYSTNPLERLNKEIKRRTNVVGVFPDEGSVIRLVGSILMEISDEWQVGRRYFSKESMRKLTSPLPAFSLSPERIKHGGKSPQGSNARSAHGDTQ